MISEFESNEYILITMAEHMMFYYKDAIEDFQKDGSEFNRGVLDECKEMLKIFRDELTASGIDYVEEFEFGEELAEMEL